MYLELHMAGGPRLFNFNFVSEVLPSGTGAKIIFETVDGKEDAVVVQVDESYDYIKEKLLSHQRAMIPQSHLI